MFLPGKRFWLTAGKLIVLAIVAGQFWVQIPELRYDLGPKEPLVISAPEQLPAERLERAKFVALVAKGDFEKAFVYRQYGLSYSYFLLESYGPRVVVRTPHQVETEQWKKFDRFLGKLHRYQRMPFRRRIRNVFRERFGVEIPKNALFLAHEDVPRLSAWNVAAAIFSIVLWLVLFYFFFFFRRKRPGRAATSEPPSSPS